MDALLVAQYYVGLNPDNFDTSAAEVNCDNEIGIVDELLITQYYVDLYRKPNGFPVFPIVAVFNFLKL